MLLFGAIRHDHINTHLCSMLLLVGFELLELGSTIHFIPLSIWLLHIKKGVVMVIS